MRRNKKKNHVTSGDMMMKGRQIDIVCCGSCCTRRKCGTGIVVIFIFNFSVLAVVVRYNNITFNNPKIDVRIYTKYRAGHTKGKELNLFSSCVLFLILFPIYLCRKGLVQKKEPKNIPPVIYFFNGIILARI